jgi:acetylornithine deacetylase/succinyl-diaminopimelate desuccinylase-like protein
MNNLLKYSDKNKDIFLEELFELLRIPSISAQSEHDEDTKDAALWLKKNLEKVGLENVAVMETEGHPVVYADYLKHKDRPTVLIYGHYDVQSPDPLDEWKSEPFEPEIREGNIYGRGTADNKGQLFTHVKAIETLLNVEGELPVNVKFLLEGEEEVGGPSLDKFIEDNKKLLKSDICVISDSHALSETQPLIDYGLRGIVYMQIDLSIMPQDAHSGSYGGNIPNASMELVNILNKLKDEETNKILIPDFYENCRVLDNKELEELASSPLSEKSIKNETGVKAVFGEEGFDIGVRAGGRPSLDINGMHSGYTMEGAKTIIPAKASAKVSMRIVPNQTADEIKDKFIKYIKEIAPDYVDISMEYISGGEPIIMDKDNKYFKFAEIAMEEAFGNKPIYELQPASIPVTATVKHILDIDSILMGFGLPDDGLHAPNEKMKLDMFYKGIETSLRFFKAFK